MPSARTARQLAAELIESTSPSRSSGDEPHHIVWTPALLNEVQRCGRDGGARRQQMLLDLPALPMHRYASRRRFQVMVMRYG